MDEICQLLSAKIYAATRSGYGIFYEDELLDVMPEDERTRDTLEAALKKLVKGGYLDVKYAKGSAFCMAGLKQFEMPVEATQPTQERVRESVPANRLWIVAFCLSFLGGALGGLIGGLIANAF